MCIVSVSKHDSLRKQTKLVVCDQVLVAVKYSCVWSSTSGCQV